MQQCTGRAVGTVHHDVAIHTSTSGGRGTSVVGVRQRIGHRRTLIAGHARAIGCLTVVGAIVAIVAKHRRAILQQILFLDPTREEEEACDVRISWGSSMWNKQLVINSCQKSGSVTFSAAEIEKMMEILPKKFDELNEKLKSFL